MPTMPMAWNAPVWAELAHQMGLVPLAVLCGLDLRGERRDVRWWWLAGMFGVSWLADTSAHYGWLPAVTASTFYPLVQAVIAGFVLLPWRPALAFNAIVLAVAVFLFGFVGVPGMPGVGAPDIEFRAVAWIAIVYLVTDDAWLGPIRTAVLLTFGLGLVAWILHARTMSLATWYPYQLVRLAGLLVFARAALIGQPALRLVTTAHHRRPPGPTRRIA